MTRIRRVAVCLAGGGSLLALAGGAAGQSGALQPGWLTPEAQSVSGPQVIVASRQDRSPPLRTLAPTFPPERPQKAPKNPAREIAPVQMPDFFDPFLQTAAPDVPMQPPNVSFDGVKNSDNDFAVLPPDTNGDVSATQYVQSVNLKFAVYSKTGTTLYGPANTNTLFSGFGGVCQNTNNGDPIVQYDQLANRWLITQFAWSNTSLGPFSQCIAVSTTSDATGSYYRYEFQISPGCNPTPPSPPNCGRLNDYPKFGVWPDGYYMSVNDFQGGSSFVGATMVAFERDKMLLGQSAQGVKFVLGTAFYSMLPSDLDGPTPPPAGSPNYFVQMDDNAWGYPQDQLEVWKFDVDWATPANSTFTSDATLATSSFDSRLLDIPQPGTSVRLDTLSDRLMYRLAYRNFGTREALVTDHTVNVGSNRAGLRWYELRRTGGSWSIFQQGTYAPGTDTLHRWMGSVAMDKFGNMAGGWSTSSSTSFPSIFFGGRLSTDAVGTLGSESTLFSGTGSQTSLSTRWGDYSSTSVDPVDDCTFWFTTEYIQTTGNAPWRTRIASFRFPACGPGGGGGSPTISGFTPTSGPVGTLVTINGTNFTGATAVTFDLVGASFTVVNSSQITATVPAGATSGHVRVTTPGGTAQSAGNFLVTAGGAPTISGFSPPSGPVGTLVTINGTNFTGASSVTFNFASASFTVVNSTQITATVPAGATSGHVRVTTPGGTAQSAGNFLVTAGGAPTISGFSPPSGPVGTLVTINGTNFTGATAVTFNFTGASFTVVNASQITATVPSGATRGHIRVTTPGGTAASAANFIVS